MEESEAAPTYKIDTTIVVTGTGKSATYKFEGRPENRVNPVTGDIDLKGIQEPVELKFKVKSGPNKLRFHTWTRTDSCLYIDGEPAIQLTGIFKNFKKVDQNTVTIEDVNTGQGKYDYLLWLTDGNTRWPLDPVIQNQ